VEGNADGLALSLNMWFDCAAEFAAPERPLRPGLMLELGRHVEYYVNQVIGHDPNVTVTAFLASCLEELDATEDAAAAAAADVANESALPRWQLVVRNLLFAELATSWVGWDGLRAFFADLLQVERFQGLPVLEPEMAGAAGVDELG
jgi:hypothetical protein